MSHQESIRLREASEMGISASRGMLLPIKQRADIELFDGDPIYSVEGKDVTRDELLKLSRKDLHRVGVSEGLVLHTPEDRARLNFSEVCNGILLPVKNRKWMEVTHNTITTVGFNWVADRLANDDTTGLNIAAGGMRLGLSNTTPSVGDDDVLTDLGVSGDYQAYSSSYPQDGGTTVAWRSFWAAGQGTVSGIQEVVIKEAQSGVTAITRIANFGSINKGASDTLQITITWTLAEG